MTDDEIDILIKAAREQWFLFESKPEGEGNSLARIFARIIEKRVRAEIAEENDY